MATKYLYEVHPLRPVLTPIEGRYTRRPFSADFTVEEVKELMPNARVYRRFPDKMEIVPVTGANLEDLHRPKFDTIDKVEIAKMDDDKEEVGKEPKAVVPAREPAAVAEDPNHEPQPAAVDETKKEVSAAEQVSTTESAEITEETKNEAEEVVEAEIPASEEISEEVSENEEKEADLEEDDTQKLEKQVSESKPSNSIYVPNSNKFHKKKH